MKRLPLIGLALICCFNIAALFASFNYLQPESLKNWLNNDKEIIIVDIQVKKEFANQHLPGSLETNAYPVKTEAEQARLAPVLEAFEKTGHDIVIICPRGGGGAKRCYSYLKSHGIPEEKLTILKGGIEKWPYRDMLVGQ